jgi:hypothetical protein
MSGIMQAMAGTPVKLVDRGGSVPIPSRTIGYRPRKQISVLVVGMLSLLFLSAMRIEAFSLLGPYESWMTPTNGFPAIGDIGGPMNIGEGYRWNVPVVTYAFDPSFVDFFGSNGEAAVESAIQILNDLPPASQVNLGNYPLNTMNEDYQVAPLGLVDLKSETLFLLLQQLGLASPTRYMFCVHDFSISNGTTNVNVVLRNFDPFSFQATNVLNGSSYASNLDWHVVGSVEYLSIVATPVDPYDANSSVADGWGGGGSAPSFFYTGLSRDDVGGLRYLLETNNLNWETLLPDVHGVGVNSNNYVNLALRAGVDKITFIPETVNFDFLTGEFYTPVTNQYTDTYVTNGILMQQQLERVSDRPDIIFSARYTNGEVNLPVERTGASNWLNNAGLNRNSDMAGPGVIRPQVTITFPHGVSSVVVTSDPNIVKDISEVRWGSFDGSTNPPVIYPVGTTGTGDPWTIHLLLLNANYQPPRPSGFFTSELPVEIGEAVTLESSTNLMDWVPLVTVTNHDIPLLWVHRYLRSAEYFRAVSP